MKLPDLPEQLNDAQIQELYNQWQLTGIPSHRQQLVEGMLRKVFVWTFDRYSKHQDDLFSVGVEALLKGLDKAGNQPRANIIGYLYHHVRRAKIEFFERVKTVYSTCHDVRVKGSFVRVEESHLCFCTDSVLDDDDLKVTWGVTQDELETIKMLAHGYTQKEIVQKLNEQGTYTIGGKKLCQGNISKLIHRVREKLSS